MFRMLRFLAVARLSGWAVLPRRRAMLAKILLAAVPQPDPQLLRDVVFLFFSQGVVEGQGFFPFSPAGPVIVGIPVAAGDPNAAAHFLYEGFSCEGLVRSGHNDNVLSGKLLSKPERLFNLT